MYAILLALPASARFLALSASSCARLSVRPLAASFLSLRSSALLVQSDPKLTVDVVDGGRGRSNEFELRTPGPRSAGPHLLSPLFRPLIPMLRSFVMPERMLPVTERSECTETAGERGAGEGESPEGEPGSSVCDRHFLTPGQANSSS